VRAPLPLPPPRRAARRESRPPIRAALHAHSLCGAQCSFAPPHRSQLKFTSKQLGRLSKKCEKEEKTEKDKIRKALEKDNNDGESALPLRVTICVRRCGWLPLIVCLRRTTCAGARIHAQNAIRQKNNAQNYLRLSSRVDAVASRLESAIKMQQVTKSMGSVVKGMDKVLGSMNVEAITKVMDQFEKSFEDMDVRSEYVESAMNSSTAAAMPEEQVDDLMQMVADEHGLKMADVFKSPQGAGMPGMAASGASSSEPQAAAAGAGPSAEDDLEERLRKLRSG
jgi:charged multivesicular body protein 1